MNYDGKFVTSLFDTKNIGDVREIVQRINEVLQKHPDKDWNYSRIELVPVDVSVLESPYLLGCEVLDLGNPLDEKTLKDVQNEIRWGDRHSSDLGILEIVSLRVNKALLAFLGQYDFLRGVPPRKNQPVLRLVKRRDLLAATVPVAIWYQVREVGGEDFDTR